MYKLIKPLKESGKMSVTPKQSECLQKALFEMGYYWVGSEQETSALFSEQPHIFWDYDKTITFCDCNIWFGNEFEENPLHKFEDYFEQ